MINTSAIATRNEAQESQPITLRRYQQEILAQTYSLIRSGKRSIVIVAVMGAGKTIISSWLMRDAASKGRRCLFLVSLNVLLDQTAQTLRKLGVHCTVLQGDRPVDESAPVIVASLQTIGARLRKGKDLGALVGYVDVVIGDECHITAFHNTYAEIEGFFQNAIRIGLTATPWRLSKKEWLGQKYEALVEGPQPPDIIKMGGAVPCRGFTIGTVLDLETLKVRNGDYVDSDIADQATRPEALEHVVNEILRICSPNIRVLMVGATVFQAEETCKYANLRGIASELVVGCTSKEEREAIFERVKTGKTRMICSVGCLTAGFDLPAIGAIAYVRATKSKALFFQTAGRGSRPYPGKTEYLLLDFGGNLKRFRNPMGWQVYDISEPAKDEAPAPTKTCPSCKAEVNRFAVLCPHCGHEFTGEQLTEEELEELLLAPLNEYVDRFTQQKIANLRRWKKEAFTHDRSPDSAIDQFKGEYGHTPPTEWQLHACLTKRYSQGRKAKFINYLLRHCKTESRWAKQWIAYHLELEFGEVDPVIVPWWESLECDRSASWDEVKRAYNQKAEQLHPDDDIAALMEALNLALEDAKAEVAVVQEGVGA